MENTVAIKNFCNKLDSTEIFLDNPFKAPSTELVIRVFSRTSKNKKPVEQPQ